MIRVLNLEDREVFILVVPLPIKEALHFLTKVGSRPNPAKYREIAAIVVLSET